MIVDRDGHEFILLLFLRFLKSRLIQVGCITIFKIPKWINIQMKSEIK